MFYSIMYQILTVNKRLLSCNRNLNLVFNLHLEMGRNYKARAQPVPEKNQARPIPNLHLEKSFADEANTRQRNGAKRN